MQYVLAIDQGTTGTRAIIFDKQGLSVSKAYYEHEQFFPKPGWVEHDPTEIWENTKKVVKESVEKANLDFSQICTIGIANQRETVVAWNKKTNKILHKAIVWQCRRTADTCNRLKEDGYSEVFKEKTGLVLDPYFSGTKITWLLDNSPKVRQVFENEELAIGTIDSWLIWNLTGNHVTDYSNASRTMLFNIQKGMWDSELLEILGISEWILPEVRPSSDKETYGKTKKELFPTEIPVSGDAGDQQAALFGQTCFNEGEVKNTYGTGNFILMNTGRKVVYSKKGLISTIAWKIDDNITYALEGSVFVTGAAIQWLEKGLNILQDKDELTDIMNEIPDAQGVVFVPAFVGLGAPYWDPSARGTIIGITRGTSRKHIIRAALESICLQSQDVFEIMEEDTGTKISMLRVDGGVTSCQPLLQFQADISNITVQMPKIQKTTALGAAYLAGLAIGFWENLKDIQNNFQIEAEFKLKMSQIRRNEAIKKWRVAVNRSLKWDV